MGFNFQCSFNFSKGTIKTQLDGRGAKVREKEFENYLSKKNKPNERSRQTYLQAVKKLPNECKKLGILDQEIDFFSLVDIEVLKELCKELKSGKLQSFNRPKKSKDAKNGGGPAHACIKEHYIPFLLIIQ